MNVLWYKKPAEGWNEALPVGNGRLGAMVYGGTAHEVIQLNEESVWSGAFHDRNNYSSRENLKNVRSLMKEGRVQEAQEFAFQTMTGTPSQQPVYQTAGELHIEFKTASNQGLQGPLFREGEVFQNCHTYRRELDLETAIATTTFTEESDLPSTAFFARNSSGNSVTYTREVFASAVTDVIVVHITASSPGSIYFRANLERGEFATKTYCLSDDTIVMEDTHGIPFAVVATAVASGGKLYAQGGCLVAQAADEVTIYIDIQTAFRKSSYARKKGNVMSKLDSLSLWCRDRALKNVCFATGAQFPVNKDNHITEYAPWYNAVSLSLKGEENDTSYAQDSKLPADELLQKPESPALAELYWNFCRYLLISSSRKPGTLPANLQGLWNKDITPPWGSKYTININTQMNYWPAAMCSIPQTEKPLFSLLARAYKNGRKTARVMYGCSGYMAHHNLDIWGDTAPQDKWIPGTYWVLGAAWLATHIREHYEYTQNKKFLRKNFYLMREACKFFLDYLVEDETGNNLIVLPSVSPENSYRHPNGQICSFSMGCDMDNRILEHLFHATLDSARDLGISSHDDDMIRIKAVLAKIEPPVITKDNTIREWPLECEEVEPGHRHMSQLYGLFPGHSINVTRSPLLAKAAHNTIEKRLANGGGHTGWSQAWILNFRASLHEAPEAYESFVSLLRNSTLTNLFDNHPPFQIDGNFGALAGVTRMIVQSEIVSGAVECTLLPALPEQWKNGNLKGVSLKGNLKADISWKNGAVCSAKIYAKNDGSHIDSVVICYRDKRYEAHLAGGSLNVMNILPTTVQE